jgi:transcription antitermination factor NusG
MHRQFYSFCFGMDFRFKNRTLFRNRYPGNRFLYFIYKQSTMADTEISTKNWYAVHTRTKWESRVCKNLEKKKINHFCPGVFRRNLFRNDMEALFPSHVFIYADEHERCLVSRMEGVINFVYWLSKPAIIPIKEIESIKDFMNCVSEVSVEKTNILPDKPVGFAAYPSANGIEWGQEKSGLFRLALPSLGYILAGLPAKSGVNRYSNPLPVLNVGHAHGSLMGLLLK